MSRLPQLTFFTGCHLPPAAPSSRFEPEESAVLSSDAESASCCSSSGDNTCRRKQASDGDRQSGSIKAKSGRAAGLRGMTAAEETLQWLAARVLQQAPPPHMLALHKVFEGLLRVDAPAASDAFLHITRNIAKVLQASRFLFVGTRTACQQLIARQVEEEQQRSVFEETQRQEAHKHHQEEKDWGEQAGKTDKRWDGEEALASWEQHLDDKTNFTFKNAADAEEDDVDDWSSVPVRDEQTSCFPWLVSTVAATAAVEAQAASSCSTSSIRAARRSEGVESKKEERTAEEGESEGQLFVLLQPICPAEEALGCPDVLIKLCNFLTVKDVISIGRVCRATVSAALSEEVWMPLLQCTFPKASLVNEDVFEGADEQQRIDQEKHKQIVDDLMVRIPPDKPVSLAALLLCANKTLAAKVAQPGGELRLRMDAEALLHLLSCHPDSFKQDAAGEVFVVQPSRLYSDWLPVNPYAVVDWGAERLRQLQQETQQLWREEQCEEAGAVHVQQQQQEAAEDAKEETEAIVFRRDLSARQAYRLWHTKLLGAEQNRDRPWEYFNACSEIGSATKSLVHKRGLTLPAGTLLDVCERRLQFVRMEDPLSVHSLVLRTLDGVMYHIASGCFNRRVNLLQQALCSPHLRLERETRKRIERRLLDFMQHVRNERKFGLFACRSCGSRWRSGFTYDEIAQQCLRCGLWNKAFSCRPLLSAQELNATQKSSSSNLLQHPQAGALSKQSQQAGSMMQPQQREIKRLWGHQRQMARWQIQEQQQEQEQSQDQHLSGNPRQQQQQQHHNQRPRGQQQQQCAPEQRQIWYAVRQQAIQQASAAQHQKPISTKQKPRGLKQPLQHSSCEQLQESPVSRTPSEQQWQHGLRNAAHTLPRRKGRTGHTAVNGQKRECSTVDFDAQSRAPPGVFQERQQRGTQRNRRGSQRQGVSALTEGRHAEDTCQEVQPTKDPTYRHDYCAAPVVRQPQGSSPHLRFQQERKAPRILSDRHDWRWKAASGSSKYSRERRADVGVEDSNEDRETLLKEQLRSRHRRELQPRGSMHAKNNCPYAFETISQGQHKENGCEETQQPQSRMPFKENNATTEKSRSARKGRNVITYSRRCDSRAMLVQKVLQQQVQPAARRKTGACSVLFASYTHFAAGKSAPHDAADPAANGPP